MEAQVIGRAREGVALTRSTIHRILLRRALVHDGQRQAAASRRFKRSTANELWQMDVKGPTLWPQAVGPLSVAR